MNTEETLIQVRKDRLKLAFDTLAAVGITQVEVRFDGCGDSGQIEEIVVEPEGKELPGHEIRWVEGQHRWGLATVGTEPGESPTGYVDKWTFDTKAGKLEDLIESIVYDYLHLEHAGWENNDGAYGEFIFEVEHRTLNYNHNTRTSDSYLDEHTYKAEE